MLNGKLNGVITFPIVNSFDSCFLLIESARNTLTIKIKSRVFVRKLFNNRFWRWRHFRKYYHWKAYAVQLDFQGQLFIEVKSWRHKFMVLIQDCSNRFFLIFESLSMKLVTEAFLQLKISRGENPWFVSLIARASIGPISWTKTETQRLICS